MRKVLSSLVLAMFFLLSGARDMRQAAGGPGLPDGVDSALLDAVCLMETGRLDEAVPMLDSLAVLSPDNDAVQYYIGLCKYSSGDAPGSLGHFRRALELDPSNGWYKETLANLYTGLGEGASAAALYKELKASDPGKFQNIYILPAIAQAYRLKRDFPAFFSTLAELVRDSETDDESKYSALMACLGNFDARTFNDILPNLDTLMQTYADAEPLSLHAHSLRMEMAARTGKDDIVIRECAKMMELAPEDASMQLQCLSIIGDTLYKQGRDKEAFRTYEAALKIDPEYCTVLNNYAYYLSLRGRRLAKAEKMSAVTVEQEPDNPTYLDTYGWILYLRGKAKKAKPYFKHAMIYGGRDSAVILWHFSVVLEKLGETDLASYYRNLAETKNK